MTTLQRDLLTIGATVVLFVVLFRTLGPLQMALLRSVVRELKTAPPGRREAAVDRLWRTLGRSAVYNTVMWVPLLTWAIFMGHWWRTGALPFRPFALAPICYFLHAVIAAVAAAWWSPHVRNAAAELLAAPEGDEAANA